MCETISVEQRPLAGALCPQCKKLHDKISLDRPLFGNYLCVENDFKYFYKRSYEGKKWYYVVAVPYTKQYESNLDYYESANALRAIIKGLKIDKKKDAVLITKEIMANKVHYNILICTDKNMMDLHRKNGFRFSYDIQELDNLGNRERVFYYMIKESNPRKFIYDTDIIRY